MVVCDVVVTPGVGSLGFIGVGVTICGLGMTAGTMGIMVGVG